MSKFILRSLAATLLVLPAITAAQLSAQARGDGPANEYGNTMKRAPRPTSAEITAEDLKTRLYIFADDSMMGRAAGREGNEKGTAYIARELQRLGLEPAGDNGTYFQGLPYYLRSYAAESRFSVGGQQLDWLTDFVPVPAAGRPALQDFGQAQVIFGGVDGDTTWQIPAGMASGRIVLLLSAPNAGIQHQIRLAEAQGATEPPTRITGSLTVNNANQVAVNVTAATAADAGDSLRAAVLAATRGGGAGAGRAGRGGGRAGGGGGRGGGRGGRGGRGGGGAAARFAGAVAIVTVDLEELTVEERAAINNPVNAAYSPPQPPIEPGNQLGAPTSTPTIRVTQRAAEMLMGVSLDSLLPGAAGKVATGRLVFNDTYKPEYGRNVVAIIRGSDSLLRNEFVAIGAHNDHTGFTNNPQDHDSVRAIATALAKLQIRGSDTLLPVTPELRTAVRINMDSIRRIRPPRPDSIRNGADDDGSGSMAVLELAEYFASQATKPRRSLIFVFHTGEESGLLGSRFFTDNPTVPRESIVAQINMDMIGRGRADDLPGGGPDYLAVVGARRLSSELGAMVEQVNRSQRRPLKLDYRFDEPTTWSGYNNIYGRSDHANYARFNIPIAFFFTGLHRDYHQITDEPQYIDYPHYNRIANYVRDLVATVANAAKRPAVDGGGE